MDIPWTVAVRAAEEKKALDLRVLDIREQSALADTFLICSGASRRQLRAILESVLKAMKEAGYSLRHQEGEADSRWVLLDFGDLVVHVFDREARRFYGLDRLWSEARVLHPASPGEELHV